MLTDRRTYGHTDGHTDRPSYRDAGTHLKMEIELQRRNISTETSVFIRHEIENIWRNMKKEGNQAEKKKNKRDKPD